MQGVPTCRTEKKVVHFLTEHYLRAKQMMLWLAAINNHGGGVARSTKS